MVPQQVICLPALPLTANGKIDRAAVTAELESLRSAARVRGHDGEARSGGLDAMQSRIAVIWASVLGLESSQSLSPASDFFALGGDSLLMAQAIGRIRREIAEASGLAWDDLLRAMVSNPTLAAAAEAVRATESRPSPSGRDAAAIGSPLVYLGAGQGFTSATEIAVCVHDGSGGLAPYEQLVPHLRAAGGPVPDLYGLRRVPGDGYSHIAPAELFTTLAARYSAPIVALAPTKVHLLGYCMGGLLAAEIAKCLEEAGIEVGTVTVVSSYRVPMDVEDDDVLDYCFAQIMGVPPGRPRDAGRRRCGPRRVYARQGALCRRDTGRRPAQRCRTRACRLPRAERRSRGATAEAAGGIGCSGRIVGRRIAHRTAVDLRAQPAGGGAWGGRAVPGRHSLPPATRRHPFPADAAGGHDRVLGGLLPGRVDRQPHRRQPLRLSDW